MKDINEVAEKMARNGLKIAKSLGCAFHFESEFIMTLERYIKGCLTYKLFEQSQEEP